MPASTLRWPGKRRRLPALVSETAQLSFDLGAAQPFDRLLGDGSVPKQIHLLAAARTWRMRSTVSPASYSSYGRIEVITSMLHEHFSSACGVSPLLAMQPNT